MKRKKEWALNKLFNLLLVVSLFSATMSISMFLEKDISWAIGCGVVALMMLASALLFTPYGYAFDQEGVSFCYVFLPNERYLWDDIHAIEVEWAKGTAKATILDTFYASVFHIIGNCVGDQRFYMQGHIRKSFRTKRLLEKYWDGTITGYMFEDVKKWNDRRRAKKQKQIKQHMTDEIVPMERRVRANVRQWLDSFIDQAKLYDLDLRTGYWYITKDLEELKSRPQEGYTYTLLVEISRPDETDEDRIWVLSVDLLHVRLGKTAYRGVENKCAKEELEFYLGDTFKRIQEEGVESLCRKG